MNGRSPLWFRTLLRLFPVRHRQAYGAEMWEVARYRRAEAGRGRWACLVAGLRTTVDVVREALAMRVGAGTTTMRRGMMGMRDGWLLDLRFVMRSLVRRPGYVVTTMVVLAAAVAVNVSILSFVRGTLLADPTYPGADRIVIGWGSNAVDGQLRDVISGPVLLQLRERARTLDAVAAFHTDGAALIEDGRPIPMTTYQVSPEFFDAVPVRPALGRVFGADQSVSTNEAVVVVSHDFWRDRLDGDPAAVGTRLVLDGEPRTVLGVLPEDFEFLMPVPLFLPVHDDVLAADDPYRIHYNMIGRLAEGATAGQATRELSSVLGEVRVEYPRFEGWSILVEPLHATTVMAVRPILWILAAAMGVLLLLALVNLTALFRIRTLARDGELGVRAALGAGSVRIARILALEAGGLAVAGALLGLAAAPWLLDGIRGMVPTWIFIPESAARVPALRAVLDPWVAGLAVAVAAGGALLLVLPSVHSAGRTGRTVRGGARRQNRTTRGLVVAELALATMLCLGAVLTARSARNVLAVDVGVEDQGLLTVYFGDVWDRPEDEQIDYFREVVRSVESLPSVRSAALIDYVPFQLEDDFARVLFLDGSFESTRELREEWRRVGEGLFETAGMPILEGRSLEPDDFRGTVRSVVINRAFAEKHYPRGDAVGSYLSTHDEDYVDMQVVGVVGDVRNLGPTEPPSPMLYVPHQGSPRGTTGLYVRSDGDIPAGLAESVRDAIWAVDPTQPVFDFAPMTDLVSAWVALPRAVRTLVGGVALLSLLLAAVGIFGVVGYAVRRRRAEFGVRMALGASPDRLRRGVLMGSLPLLLGGMVAGVGVGLLGARAARAVLFGVAPTDPLSLGTAVALIGAAAVVAVWLPARSASRVDPSSVIRAE